MHTPPTSFYIPPHLREALAHFGAEGERWLADLPARVAELEQAWSLTVQTALDSDGCCALIAPVRLADGSQAILKIGIPHREARRESDGLRVWDGHGAVRLLRASADGFSLLLERCVPGTNLWSLSEEEADAAAAGVLKRLWREPPPTAPIERLSDLAAEWCEGLPRTAPAKGYDEEMVAHAVDLACQLAATQPRRVLLHGDFHPGNVLAAEREPWLAIDCKPVVGDPAYDLAQWIGNRYEAAEHSPDPVACLRRQIDRFGHLLNMDPARIAGWTFVKSLGWDWEPPVARVFRAVLAA
jgi:streptomycin 6-kinase